MKMADITFTKDIICSPNMIKIHREFIGGNIRVISIDGDVITLENELRDSSEWFYWAFCIEGAEGRELTFNMQKNRLGYWGPAVSHDLKTWQWLGSSDENSFTYRFGADERRVYFAHNMLYHPDHFFDFLRESNLMASELCKSRKGRSVPYLTLGNGDRSIILTARHHACESTGSYVLEGVLRELVDAPIENTRIFAVPFVDYDGVVDGDQGKARTPHDHNRDYSDAPIYPEVDAIIKYADRYGCHLGFDFHSPWHKGGENDNIFIVTNRIEDQDRYERFSDILQKEISHTDIVYEKKNDLLPMTGWNKPCPAFGYSMSLREECDIAFTLETAYFGTENNKISTDKLIRLGRSFAKAIRNYIEATNENH